MTRNLAGNKLKLSCHVLKEEAESLSASKFAAPAIRQLIARDNGLRAATLDAAG
jgi:hypothetical protein